MVLRYYKRPCEASRGDVFAFWGPSVRYLEVDDGGYAVRALEHYNSGAVLKYSAEHRQDFYGGLGGQPLDCDELAAFEIGQREFETAWSELEVIGTDADSAYNDVFGAISRHLNAPLHDAANGDNPALVQILLDAGARVDARCADGWTSLMRACNAGNLEAAKVLVRAGARLDATNSEGYTAYGRVRGNAPELLGFMMTHLELERIGVRRPAATALQSAATRRAGLLVVCGPAGVGKTELAEVLEKHTGIRMLGDLRAPAEIVDALGRAQHESVICMVRSGESFGLSSRWDDMGIARELIASASVTTVTLRRLPGCAPTASRDVLLVEVLGPDNQASLGSLAEQARALVSAGLVTDEAARFNVPGYE